DRVYAVWYRQVPLHEAQRCEGTHLRLSRHHHRLLRVRGYGEGAEPLGTGAFSQPVGQARPGRAVRVLAIHACPSQAVIPRRGADAPQTEARRRRVRIRLTSIDPVDQKILETFLES